MKISEIVLYRCAAQLPEAFGSATRVFERKEALFVEIRSDGGLSGWGETGLSVEAVAAHIRARAGASLLGKDPDAIGALWRGLAELAGNDRAGVAVFAQAALDIALHDLAARRRGVSVAALLGGALRNRLPTYASGPFLRPAADPYRLFERDAGRYLERGFRAIKARAGVAAAADGRMAASLRKLAGPDAALMVDFNRSYTPAAAIESAHRMGESGLQWIEEPATPEDVAGYLQVGRAVRPAIAGGEALTNAVQFRPFLAAGALHIAQPDISNCGGFTGMGKVAALCEAFEIPLVPHAFGGVVNFAATLQFAATLPVKRGGGFAPYPWLEWSQLGDPMLSLLGVPALDRDGTVAIPDGPGLGIKLTAERLGPFVQESWTIRPQ